MLNKVRNHRYLKYCFNPFILIGLLFIIWMAFFDDNSVLFHQELNDIIQEKEAEKKLYKEDIDTDKAIIKQLEDKDNLENFAREEYYYKKENEEIYLIEHQNKTEAKNDE